MTDNELRTAIEYAAARLNQALEQIYGSKPTNPTNPTVNPYSIAGIGIALGTLKLLAALSIRYQKEPIDTTSTVADDWDWQALADTVKARRHWLRMSQPDVAKAGGPSEQTVSRIETLSRRSYTSETFTTLEKALQWSPGTIKAILAGTVENRSALINAKSTKDQNG